MRLHCELYMYPSIAPGHEPMEIRRIEADKLLRLVTSLIERVSPAQNVHILKLYCIL